MFFLKNFLNLFETRASFRGYTIRLILLPSSRSFDLQYLIFLGTLIFRLFMFSTARYCVLRSGWGTYALNATSF